MSRFKRIISNAIQPKIVLSIGSKFITHYKKIELKQNINEHHTFKVILDHDVIEKYGSHTLDKSKEWLSESMTISFGDLDFLGTITQVKMSHDDGFDGDIIISGFSPTIQLEAGNHTQSWVGRSLNTIVNDVVRDVNLHVAIKPTYQEPIAYEVQYNESHFHFLQRLAKKYNEWFFYDGTQLCFGKPKLEKPVAIQYGADMLSISLKMETFASRKKQISYVAMQDNLLTDKTRDTIKGLNELADDAFIASNSLYTIIPKDHSPSYVEDKMRIDRELERTQSAAVAEGNTLEAKSSRVGIGLATVLKISAARFKDVTFDMGSMTQFSIKKKVNFDVKQYGEYLITGITHKAESNFVYSNEITALAGGLDVLPPPKVTSPIAEPQLAEVIKNNDPKGQGRIQARFLWQDGVMQTDWIRVMTPDAGKTKDHNEIRGNLVIPEVGDQVMIGFEYNDPNRPFVMGSMYHANNIEKGLHNRNSIISRTGSRMIMDDNDGSIQLTDKGTVNMKFDGKGNATTYVSANNNLHTGATHNVNVGATREQPAQATFKMDKDGNILLDSKTSITFKVGGNSITISEEGIIAKAEKGTIENHTKEGDIIIAAKTDVNILSETANASIKGSVNTNLGGGSKAIVTGGKVEINKG